MLRKMIFIIFLLWSTQSAANSWTHNVEVTKIYSVNENQVVIKLSDFSNPDNGSTIAHGDLVLDPSIRTSPFAIFLTAFTAGKSVDLYT